MEHLVQFGISVDDERIEKAVIDAASKEVMKAFENDGSYYYRRGISAEKIIAREVEKKLNDWKDEIINKASDKLVESMRRTKAVKEATVKALSEFESEW